MTQPWRDRPPHIKQRLARGSGSPRIHVEHPGGGLVMNIHLGDVGPHAISFGHSGDYSGGVCSTDTWQRVILAAREHRRGQS